MDTSHTPTPTSLASTIVAMPYSTVRNLDETTQTGGRIRRGDLTGDRQER